MSKPPNRKSPKLALIKVKLIAANERKYNLDQANRGTFLKGTLFRGETLKCTLELALNTKETITT